MGLMSWIRGKPPPVLPESMSDTHRSTRSVIKHQGFGDNCIECYFSALQPNTCFFCGRSRIKPIPSRWISAARRGNVAAFQDLADREGGTSLLSLLKHRSTDNRSLLHYAATCDNIELIHFLVMADGSLLNLIDKNGHSALTCAVSTGSCRAASMLASFDGVILDPETIRLCTSSPVPFFSSLIESYKHGTSLPLVTERRDSPCSRSNAATVIAAAWRGYTVRSKYSEELQLRGTERAIVHAFASLRSAMLNGPGQDSDTLYPGALTALERIQSLRRNLCATSGATAHLSQSAGMELPPFNTLDFNTTMLMLNGSFTRAQLDNETVRLFIRCEKTAGVMRIRAKPSETSSELETLPMDCGPIALKLHPARSCVMHNDAVWIRLATDGMALGWNASQAWVLAVRGTNKEAFPLFEAAHGTDYGSMSASMLADSVEEARPGKPYIPIPNRAADERALLSEGKANFCPPMVGPPPPSITPSDFHKLFQELWLASKPNQALALIHHQPAALHGLLHALADAGLPDAIEALLQQATTQEIAPDSNADVGDVLPFMQDRTAIADNSHQTKYLVKHSSAALDSPTTVQAQLNLYDGAGRTALQAACEQPQSISAALALLAAGTSELAEVPYCGSTVTLPSTASPDLHWGELMGNTQDGVERLQGMHSDRVVLPDKSAKTGWVYGRRCDDGAHGWIWVPQVRPLRSSADAANTLSPRSLAAFAALKNNHLDLLEVLVKRYPQLVDAQDLDGYSLVTRTCIEALHSWVKGTPLCQHASFVRDFEPCGTYAGSRPAMTFKNGHCGLGYYRDISLQSDKFRNELVAEVTRRANLRRLTNECVQGSKPQHMMRCTDLPELPAAESALPYSEEACQLVHSTLTRLQGMGCKIWLGDGRGRTALQFAAHLSTPDLAVVITNMIAAEGDNEGLVRPHASSGINALGFAALSGGSDTFRELHKILNVQISELIADAQPESAARLMQWWGSDLARYAVTYYNWSAVERLLQVGVPISGKTLCHLASSDINSEDHRLLVLTAIQKACTRLNHHVGIKQLMPTTENAGTVRMAILGPHLDTAMDILRSTLFLHNSFPDDHSVNELVAQCLYEGPLAPAIHMLLCADTGGLSRAGDLLAQLPWTSATHAPQLLEMVFAGGAFDLQQPIGGAEGRASLLTTILQQGRLEYLLPRLPEMVDIIETVIQGKDRQMETLINLLERLVTEGESTAGICEIILHSSILEYAISQQKSHNQDRVYKLLSHFPDHPSVICCEICGEARPLEPVVKNSGGEHFRKAMCDHSFCPSCLESWIATKVAENSALIRCPEPKCTCILYADDVERLGKAYHAKFMELRTRDCGDRLREAMSDPGMRKWLELNTRACPSCAVLIERSAGCNAMLCNCGTRFTWTDQSVQPATRLQAV